jgi:hypothetical protein
MLSERRVIQETVISIRGDQIKPGGVLLTKTVSEHPIRIERLSVGLLDCQFCALESDAAVGAVAERLIHRATAAT